MTIGTSVIIRSTDSGMPQLSNSAGTLTGVLKNVLVNSLGWTIEYEGTNVVVFRMKGGSRTFLRIDDNNTYGAQCAEVSSYSTMTSVNNGSERMPNLNFPAFIFKYANAGNIPWTIVGDDAGFWLILKSYYNSDIAYLKHMVSVTYFGDYCPWDIKNKWPFCMFANRLINSGESFYIHAPDTSVAHMVQRGHTFTKGHTYIGLLPFNNNTYFGQNLYVVNSTGANKLNGNFMCSPIHIYETASSGTLILGSIPGVLEPIMVSPSTTLTKDGCLPVETIDSDGGRSILFYVYNGNTTYNVVGKIIIKVGKGFRDVR